MITVLTTRTLVATTVLAAGTAGLLPVVSAQAASAPAPLWATATQQSTRQTTHPIVPTLVDVRAAHHPGLDRLVFQFRGPVPTQYGAPTPCPV
ncbi:hypothetical protein [Planobispora longispora]|uniref:Uncharacterized protein n=1 Tax=Planobispora longispora TaxID=28887 RepID=A0A8J3RQY1_9ACTN|nr:hypothetical protein [Planobispora longispora]GIH78252.1 hypothetical protein Plo01_46810 [Planobispora longispora]